MDFNNAINSEITSSTFNVASNYSISEDGVVKAPNQIAFLAALVDPTGLLFNITGDGRTWQVFCNYTYYNNGIGFDTATSVFTAPVPGRYAFTYTIAVLNLNSDHTYYLLYAQLSTGKSIRLGVLDPQASMVPDDGALSINGAFHTSLNAGDTVSLQLKIDGGANVVQGLGTAVPSAGTNTFFSGVLLG